MLPGQPARCRRYGHGSPCPRVNPAGWRRARHNLASFASLRLCVPRATSQGKRAKPRYREQAACRSGTGLPACSAGVLACVSWPFGSNPYRSAQRRPARSMPLRAKAGRPACETWAGLPVGSIGVPWRASDCARAPRPQSGLGQGCPCHLCRRGRLRYLSGHAAALGGISARTPAGRQSRRPRTKIGDDVRFSVWVSQGSAS